MLEAGAVYALLCQVHREARSPIGGIKLSSLASADERAECFRARSDQLSYLVVRQSAFQKKKLSLSTCDGERLGNKTTPFLETSSITHRGFLWLRAELIRPHRDRCDKLLSGRPHSPESCTAEARVCESAASCACRSDRAREGCSESITRWREGLWSTWDCACGGAGCCFAAAAAIAAAIATVSPSVAARLRWRVCSRVRAHGSNKNLNPNTQP
mmetsp:Transcript_86301/g.217219  ORF Transcript_86301/g.217219 Transcript_86301/m.217219 type:complete len:214 (+) Transcript_86301:1889-2530(+)